MKTLMPGDEVIIDDYSYSLTLYKGEIQEWYGWYSQQEKGKRIFNAKAKVLASCGLVLPSRVESDTSGKYPNYTPLTNDTIVRRLEDDAIFFISHEFLIKCAAST